MAGNDFNLDDILVDDILADLAREQEQGAPRRAPDDVDVDRLLAGLSGEAAPEEQAPKPKPPAPEEPAKREPPPRRRPEQAQEPAVLDEALLREETVPLPLKQEEEPPARGKGRKNKAKKGSPEGYWGDIKGITEIQGPSAKELHQRRVEEKMLAYKKAHENKEQRGFFGRKVRTEQLSRTMDLQVVNPIAPAPERGAEELLERDTHAGETAAQPEELEVHRTESLDAILERAAQDAKEAAAEAVPLADSLDDILERAAQSVEEPAPEEPPPADSLDDILDRVARNVEEPAPEADPPADNLDGILERAAQNVEEPVPEEKPQEEAPPPVEEKPVETVLEFPGKKAKEEPQQQEPQETEAEGEPNTPTVRFPHLKEPEQEQEVVLRPQEEKEEADRRENELSERRAQAKSDFKIGPIRLDGEEEEEEEPGNVEEEPEPQEEIEDFSSYDDTMSVNHEFMGLMTSLVSRLTALCILFLLALYLTFSSQYDLMLPDQISAVDAPILYTAVQLGLVVIGAAVSAKAVFSGLGALFTGRANSDSVSSLVCLGVVAQCVSMFFFPESVSGGRVVLYSAAALLAMLVNTVGKLYIINRARLNFKLVSTENYVKRAAMEVTEEELLQHIPHDTDIEDAMVCAPVKAGLLSNFLRISYMRDITDRVCRWMVPVTGLCAVLVAVLSYFVFHNTVPVSISVFSAGLCICAPICAVLNTNIPLFRANSRLVPSGAMIANYDACERFGDVGALVMDLSDLLPEHSVKLHSIKTFKDERIDEVLTEVASLTHSVSHPLSKLFLQIIDDRFDLLKPVESVTFEENMGISGWVGNQRVLLGNRDMMTNHGVLIPEKDFERKYLSLGYDLIYFSRGGKIAAIFIVQYEVSDREKEEFGKLEREGMRVYIRTYDANISDKKLAEMYGTEQGTLTVLPFRAFGVFDRVCGPRKELDASIAYTSDISSFVRALLAAIKIKNTANLSNLLMLCSVGLGLLFVVLLVLFGAMSRASIMTVLVYQLFWMVLLLIILNFHRY